MKTIVDGIVYEKPISIWLPSTKEIDSTGKLKENWELAVKHRIKIINAKSYAELKEALKDLKNYVKVGEYFQDPLDWRQIEVYTGDGFYSYYQEEDRDDGRMYWYANFYRNRKAELFQLITGAASYRDSASYQTNTSMDLGLLLNNEVPKRRYGEPYTYPYIEDIERLKKLIDMFQTGAISVNDARFILETCYPQFEIFATKGLDCIELEPIQTMKVEKHQKEEIESNYQVYKLAKRFNDISHSK